EKATAAFASWGKSLGQSQGFQSFITYARENVPKLIALIKNIGSAIGNIVSALAPFGSAALGGLAGLAGWISKLSPSAIQAIAIAIGGIVLGVKAWTIAQRLLNVVLSKNPIGLIVMAIGALVAAMVYAYQNSETFRNIVNAVLQAVGEAATWLWETVLQPVFIALGGIVLGVKAWTIAQRLLNVVLSKNPIGLIVMAIGALVAAMVYAYQNSETFRNIVNAVLQAVGEAATWLWETVLQPVFNALVELWQNVVAPAATWLWETVIKPAFDGIGQAIKWAWETLIQPAVAALVLYWQKVLGPVITWLWNNIVKPAWDAIGKGIKAAWDSIIKPAVAALVAYWQNILGPALKWLWENVVKPVWNFIGDAIKTAWEKVIQPAVKALWTFISETLP